MTSTILQPMAWTNERLRLSSGDQSGLKKTLYKMIVVENNNNNINNNNNNNNNNNISTKNNNNINKSKNDSDSKNNNSINNDEKLADFLTKRGLSNNMSLLKIFAINALELSAPATPVLLQQSNSITPGWLQLAGHPERIAPAANGIVRKKVSGYNDCEVIAYEAIRSDPYASKVTPRYIGLQQIKGTGESYIELQDLLHGFKDPNVMDIKMGCRTFLESEVRNNTLRSDLYNKMVSVDSNAPSEEEHQLKAITKLRYMLFREQMSSSQSKGFRIEALKMKGSSPVTDMKTVKTGSEVHTTISHFLNGKKSVTKELIKRLKLMRSLIEKSDFFQIHEVVGSSVFIVYDDEHIGAWLIDFAKSHPLPNGITVDHRKPWMPGNFEEGLLHGFDELINVFEEIHQTQTKCDSRKCSRR